MFYLQMEHYVGTKNPILSEENRLKVVCIFMIPSSLCGCICGCELHTHEEGGVCMVSLTCGI